MDNGISHAFGRLEGMLSQIRDKLDRNAEEIARHGVRLDRVEADVTGLKAENTAEQTRGMSVRAAITVALCGALASGLIGLLIQLLTR